MGSQPIFFHTFILHFHIMEYFLKISDSIIRWMGQKSALLNILLVVLICYDVLQRYIFNSSYNWIIELEWHIFGIIFLMGSAYTLKEDKHVRVDVYYEGFSPKNKAITNILGSVFFLIPWCIVGITTCFKYASNAWYIHEGSPNPGGLPAWYIIKFCIVLCFLLLFLQAITIICQNIKALSR